MEEKSVHDIILERAMSIPEDLKNSGWTCFHSGMTEEEIRKAFSEMITIAKASKDEV